MNTSVAEIALNPVFHVHTIHIEEDCHYVHRLFSTRTLTFTGISREYQLVDFSIAMVKSRHDVVVLGKLMLHSPHQFERECKDKTNEDMIMHTTISIIGEHKSCSP